MKRQSLSRIAREFHFNPMIFWQYLNGQRNASPLNADRLAALTGVDIRVWLKGGSPEARRAAVEAWAERQRTSDLSAGGAES